MTTYAQYGVGTTLKRAGYVIAEMTEIVPPNPVTNMIPVTNFLSPEMWEESIGGKIKPGKMSFVANFWPGDTDGQMALFTDRDNRTLQDFEVIGPASIGTSMSFKGVVTECSYTLAQDKEVALKVVIEISGKVTFSSGATGDLTGLTISVGTLSPAFVGTKYAYGVALTNGTASVTVTATKAGAEYIMVNGSVVTSGNASGAILTPVGVTTIIIVVKDAGKCPKVYVIYAARTS